MKFLWTTIYVSSLDESIRFYEELLGLNVLRRFPAGPGMEIAFLGNGKDGETLVELIVDEKKGKINHSESISIGFAVESMEDMLETIKKRNIPIHDGPIEAPNSKFFSIKDINGVIVQFFQQK